MFVAVGAGVPVNVPVAVAVDVGVPDAHALPKISENALAEPVSLPALSLMLIVQLPFGFCPSNALNGLFGENEPVGNAAFVSAPHLCQSNLQVGRVYQ